jgi:hypothetical protein
MEPAPVQQQLPPRRAQLSPSSVRGSQSGKCSTLSSSAIQHHLSGCRIHCCVELTELSTNKQHSLSLADASVSARRTSRARQRPARPAAFGAPVSISLSLFRIFLSLSYYYYYYYYYFWIIDLIIIIKFFGKINKLFRKMRV